MKTIITHFYNEEYLLPWWLNHHKNLFDHGILIDYDSTDRSVEIIKEICPTWEIVKSVNTEFDWFSNDNEVMMYERNIVGWRISLTLTEFFIGDIDTLTKDTDKRVQWKIPSLVFAEYNPDGYLDPNKKLWEQAKIGSFYTDLANAPGWACRSLHNYNDIAYTSGRHFLDENTDLALIFRYSHLLVGEPMIKRKLQIQHKVPESNKKDKSAANHCSFDDDHLHMGNLYSTYKKAIGDTYDCTTLMNSVLKYI